MGSTTLLGTLTPLKEGTSPSSKTGRKGVRTGSGGDKFRAMEAAVSQRKLYLMVLIFLSVSIQQIRVGQT